MKQSTIRFQSFPRTEPPKDFIFSVVEVFKKHEEKISTVSLLKGLQSDEVLRMLSSDLIELGWEIETSKKKKDKIERPVFFGEGGKPTLKYEIDGYHKRLKCGLEIEAARAIMGNAIYKDLIQALIMVDIDHLILAVPNQYKYLTKQKSTLSSDYDRTIIVAEALYSHNRLQLPYHLTVIGY